MTPSTYSAVGDVVTFQFTVTNTGNVTLRDTITVVDGDIPATLSCPSVGPVDVAPGGSVVCSAPWSADQADLDAGSFVNTAVANTTFNGGGVVTPVPGSATATGRRLSSRRATLRVTAIALRTRATRRFWVRSRLRTI